VLAKAMALHHGMANGQEKCSSIGDKDGAAWCMWAGVETVGGGAGFGPVVMALSFGHGRLHMEENYPVA
jgi:hypothetical protein